jgi:hypothetical protein
MGLVTDFSRATEIRNSSKKLYSGEHHAQCAVWAIGRYETLVRRLDMMSPVVYTSPDA